MDVKEGEEGQMNKNVMSEVVGIVEGVVQAIETITKEGREQEGEETSRMELSFLGIFEIA